MKIPQDVNAEIAQLDETVYESLKRYMSVLEVVGFVSYKTVQEILFTIFVQEFIEGPLFNYVTSEDYSFIEKAVNCVLGKCLIPYVDCIKCKKAVMPPKTMARYTEEGILRFDTTGEIRIPSL